MLAPWPRLVLEYAPFGTLESITFTIEETKTILVQGASVLVDLHERAVPIVHRDIKPANILWTANPPHIKFTDFGLSTVESKLATFCGTKLYLAREVYKDKLYTTGVDIWSFGLVVFECAYGLPARPRKCHDERWCEIIVEKVNDWEDDDLIGLL
jgi:serine/threonine-protein kinase Chk2